MSERTFTDSPATRRRVPLLIALVGPAGSGKTYSALSLAAGIARVDPGPVFMIDTEANRALHYAPAAGEKPDPARGTFEFRHVPFGKPFSPSDYREVIDHCVAQGARTIVIDSMSHEHEGPGGVLEMHEDELTRRCGNDWKYREKMTFAAWIKPKADRTRLINQIVQLGVNLVMCFRAKEKLKFRTGKEPENLGWMPIGGDEFWFEMTTTALLLPGCHGVPTFNAEEPGSKLVTKLPGQFRGLFREQHALCLADGEAMASWASGGGKVAAPANKPAEPAAPAVELVFPWQVPEIAALATPAEIEQMRGAKGKYRDGVPADKAGPVVAGIIATLKGRRTTEQMQQPAGPA